MPVHGVSCERLQPRIHDSLRVVRRLVSFVYAGIYASRMLYDAFICHASEDKNDFVRPLAERLRQEHVEVWYDEFSLNVGDSLRRSIDRGLAQSRFGIVVLSPSFFRKHWSQWELD